jgi:hypothetical protein
VLLDLDGTLISSFTPKRAPRLPAAMATHLVGVGSALNPGGVFVVERPGLRRFLEELSAFAEVVVFTAGGGGAAAGGGGRARVQGGEISGAGGSGAGGEAWSVPGVADSSNHQAWCLVPVLTRRRPLLQHTRPHAPTPQPPPPPPGLREYAAPIIDAVDPSGSLIAARIFREGTTRSEHYQCVKDMARVGRPLSRTVLVDDTPLAFLHQPGNGVPVLGFRGDPDDRLLAEAVLPLLQVRAGPSARAHRRPPPASRRLPRGSCAPLSLALPLHRPASSPAPSEPAAPSPPHRSPDARRGARRAAAARAPLRHG